MKLFGVTLDKALTYTTHVNEGFKKSLKLMSALHPLVKDKSGLNLENRVCLYKTFVRPLLSYAIPVWNVTSVSNMRRIDICEEP